MGKMLSPTELGRQCHAQGRPFAGPYRPPYKYVRHPIYLGILLGICGTAAVIGEWQGVLALGLSLAALMYKCKVEERTMRAAFPEYEAYRRETAALIPFVF